MQVLLLVDIPKLGKKGQVVVVADGFARNALFPSKKAVPATSGVIAKMEEKAQALVSGTAKIQARAEELKTRLEKRTITIHAKAAPDGKLFGAIREKDIAEAISRELGREVRKEQIELRMPIKSAGEHVTTLKFQGNATVQIKLSIKGDV